MIAECRGLVAVDDEAVRTDLHILVTQRLGVQDQLDHGPLLDVRHGVDRLKISEYVENKFLVVKTNL